MKTIAKTHLSYKFTQPQAMHWLHEPLVLETQQTLP